MFKLPMQVQREYQSEVVQDENTRSHRPQGNPQSECDCYSAGGDYEVGPKRKAVLLVSEVWYLEDPSNGIKEAVDG